MIEGNRESLTGEQKELVQEIASGILEIAKLDGLAKVANTVQKIFKLKQSDENKLVSALSEFVKSENISETVLKKASAVVGNLKGDILLQYRNNHDSLKQKLFDTYGTELQETTEKEALYSLICYIVEACYRNIQDHVSPQKMMEQVLKNTDNIQQNTDNIQQKVNNIEKNTQEIKEEIEDLRGKTPPSGNVPVSHNATYEEKFTDRFFLEEEMPENEDLCSLNNVFVEPVLMHDTTSSLNAKLKKWSADYDKKSGERSDAMYSVFLLYGKAGVGKSSYTAKLIYSQPFGKNWLALELRSCADRLKSADAWNSVKAVFGAVDDKAYENSILILDGLDEVCVLYPNFNGKAFVENLQNENALKTKNIKLLITSREGYFKDIEYRSNLLMDTIQWTEEQVGEWCEQYCKVHPSRIPWAEKFMADYHELFENDKRREIFCIPIILYLCCVRGIDIGSESTVVGIYERAFRAVGVHEHHPTTDEKMKQADAHTLAVNWQYTKELAFRIFLDGKSPTVLGNDGIKDAKAHTKERIENCEPELDRYYALFPFASEKKQDGKPEGMEFAHKTVTDYFTAVKLYEDYFETALEQDDPVRALWEGFWRAFRYKKMPNDIMGYLAQVIRNRHERDHETYHKKFFDCYDEGVKAQTIWRMLDTPEYTCKMQYSQLPQQVGLVFRNLTWLLYYLGYKRFEKEPEKEYTDGVSTFFQRGVKMDVQCYRWKGLRGADLRGADLSNAGLICADLSDADLRGAYLVDAGLSGAHLSGADLCGANLVRADLCDAHLVGADLCGANLVGADLSDANLHVVTLWDTDLPQLDKAIPKYRVQLFDPIVLGRETGERLKYNPETNRAEEPEQT